MTIMALNNRLTGAKVNIDHAGINWPKQRKLQ